MSQGSRMVFRLSTSVRNVRSGNFLLRRSPFVRQTSPPVNSPVPLGSVDGLISQPNSSAVLEHFLKFEKSAILCNFIRRVRVDNMGMAEFCHMAQHTVGYNEVEAKAFLDRAADVGLLIVLPNDIIHLRPLEVISAAHKSMGLLDPIHEKLASELATVNAQLQPLQVQKEELDKFAKKLDQRVWTLAAAGLGSLGWVMARLVFIDFDWDVMEPVSYFVMQAGVWVAAVYFAWYGREYTPTDVQLRIATQRQVRSDATAAAAAATAAARRAPNAAGAEAAAATAAAAAVAAVTTTASATATPSPLHSRRRGLLFVL